METEVSLRELQIGYAKNFGNNQRNLRIGVRELVPHTPSVTHSRIGYVEHNYLRTHRDLAIWTRKPSVPVEHYTQEKQYPSDRATTQSFNPL